MTSKEKTENGWKETTVKYIAILPGKYKKEFSPIEGWNSFHEKHPDLARKPWRKHCNYCSTEWTKLTGSVNLIMTNDGNKVVCDKCFEFLTEVAK